jgi:pimeloyl-ACP methyl ester carboxylesterase
VTVGGLAEAGTSDAWPSATSLGGRLWRRAPLRGSGALAIMMRMGTIDARTISANGIRQQVYLGGSDGGQPVLFVHGNCSSAAFWRPLWRQLTGDYYVIAPDLRGYGGTEAAPVDAMRGLADFADDVAAVLDAVAPGARPLVVGHSMGGGVAVQLTIARPESVAALVLESPVSPYGFGGTRDTAGTPTTPDFAGTGGGAVNPEFVKLLAAGERSGDNQASPRAVLRACYVADPASLGADEEPLLDTVVSTVVGTDNYPGDSEASPNWPMIGPGRRGVLNAMSPRWLNLTGIVDIPVKPPVTWIRGDADVIVSDASLFDLAQLGSLGLVPGWPGAQDCPPQPMVAQTRAVLDRYAAAGGRYREIVFEACGHSPHIEQPDRFAAALAEAAGLT